MIDGKWHLRKLRGRWQGVLKQGRALTIRWLPLNCPAFWLRTPAPKNSGVHHD